MFYKHVVEVMVFTFKKLLRRLHCNKLSHHRSIVRPIQLTDNIDSNAKETIPILKFPKMCYCNEYVTYQFLHVICYIFL